MVAAIPISIVLGASRYDFWRSWWRWVGIVAVNVAHAAQPSGERSTGSATPATSRRAPQGRAACSTRRRDAVGRTCSA